MANPSGGNVPNPEDWFASRIPNDPTQEQNAFLNQDLIKILKNTPGGESFSKATPHEVLVKEALNQGGIQPNVGDFTTPRSNPYYVGDPLDTMNGPAKQKVMNSLFSPNELAAANIRQSVRPEGGRKEGPATGGLDEAAKGIPILGAYAQDTPAAARFREEHPGQVFGAHLLGGVAGTGGLTYAAGASALGKLYPALTMGGASAALGGGDTLARGGTAGEAVENAAGNALPFGVYKFGQVIPKLAPWAWGGYLANNSYENAPPMEMLKHDINKVNKQNSSLYPGESNQDYIERMRNYYAE